MFEFIQGMSSLMYACREGFYEVVELLLENNSDMTLLDKQNKTALFYAKTDEIAELVECCEMTTFEKKTLFMYPLHSLI